MADLGVYQPSLLGGGDPAVDGGAPILRHWLDDTSWLDVGSAWLQGADTLLVDLAERLAWSCGRRRMYDRMVDDPRLSATCEVGGDGTPAIFDTMAAALGARYGERLDSVWVNYYRDGQDSVAWHSDRVGRTQRQPLVAIVTLGGPRRFLLRPRGGGRSQSFAPASGDLLVMGGDCQHHWEHTVPKAKTAQPRMSVTFRRRERGGDETATSPGAAALAQSM